MAKIIPLLVFTTFIEAAIAQSDLAYQGLKAEGEQRWHDALSIYHIILLTDPEQLDIWIRVADINAKLKRNDSMLWAIRGAAQQSPDDPEIQYRLSQAYGINNKPHEAMLAIKQALKHDPTNARYLRQQAELSTWTGDNAQARKSYSALLDLNPNDSPVQLSIARTHARAWELDEAAESYQDYIDSHPDDTATLLAYADVEIYRGDYAHAHALQEKYYKKKGRDRLFRIARANLYARSGYSITALQSVIPLLTAEPDHYELHLMHTLALNQNREQRAALSSLQELENLGSSRPETAGARLQVETPLRTQLGIGADYYSDSDDIRILRSKLFFGYSPTPELRLTTGIARSRLKADSGSGLEPLNGPNNINLDELWLTGRYQFSSKFAARLGIGTAENSRDDDSTTYHFDLEYNFSDQFVSRYEYKRDLVDVSPRAVEIFTTRDNHLLHFSWRPNYSSHIDSEFLYAEYEDGNILTRATVSPRWVTLRTQKHNLDLGLMAQWSGFKMNLNNGYYDPSEFLRLWAVAYYYRKLNDNDGISVVVGLGPERDLDLDRSYELGGHLSLEGIFGIYQDWQLRSYASVGGRFSDSGAGSATGRLRAFRGYRIGFELIRRF